MRHEIQAGQEPRRPLDGSDAIRAGLRRWSAVAISATFITNAAPALTTRAQDARDHALHHDKFYRHQKIPGTETPCCNGRDCRPARFRITPAGVQFFINARWVVPPPGRIIQTRTPDGGGHWCGIAFEGMLPHTYCAIIPPTGS